MNLTGSERGFFIWRGFTFSVRHEEMSPADSLILNNFS
ncbi:hypothetical protein DCCM_0513 [Desulfocucumis palustris]|uniref:Uncharacterized protein n=1 Tax=Desulfocucumis palustris TaxID=1898651 RepID=A0A2L2X807_9FIRM|nr:hypothetical protein DCCM_0513 [Desulfocucumis palustris]